MLISNTILLEKITGLLIGLHNDEKKSFFNFFIIYNAIIPEEELDDPFGILDASYELKNSFTLEKKWGLINDRDFAPIEEILGLIVKKERDIQL